MSIRKIDSRHRHSDGRLSVPSFSVYTDPVTALSRRLHTALLSHPTGVAVSMKCMFCMFFILNDSIGYMSRVTLHFLFLYNKSNPDNKCRDVSLIQHAFPVMVYAFHFYSCSVSNLTCAQHQCCHELAFSVLLIREERSLAVNMQRQSGRICQGSVCH